MVFKSLLLSGSAVLAPVLFLPSLAMAQTPQTSVEGAPQETSAPQEPDVAEDDVQEPAREVITVLGRNIPEPMRETSEVATFLSTEDLERTGDDNAAAALTRLAGLSVVGERFVYVRGLGDRYSSALLNGSPLPSPEPLRRQVPLDLFPSNILQGADVQKTFSPNFPGEFGGGIINLKTLKIPRKPFVSISTGTGWNVESTRRRGYSYFGNDTDWYGFDDGLRDIPRPLQQAIATGRRVDDSNFTPAQLETIGESLVNSELNVVQSVKLQPDFEGEISGGTKLQFGGFDLGMVGVVGYDNSWRSSRSRRTEVVGNSVEDHGRCGVQRLRRVDLPDRQSLAFAVWSQCPLDDQVWPGGAGYRLQPAGRRPDQSARQ
jgi:TonB-dependent Receptor Plug Domain